MKQTRKIFVALLVLMTILMSLAVVAIPASAAGETTVSKSHTDIANIAGVTVGQNTGIIADKEIALDDYISIVAKKGGSTSDPCIYSESIRLYQNGATLTVKGAEGCQMTQIVITVANNSSGKGPISVTGGTASALSNLKYTIAVNSDVSEVVIKTSGTTKTTRVYVANIEVTYEILGSADCAHSNMVTEIVDPTCTEAGKVIEKCADCSYVASENEGAPALGHLDENADYICERCEDPAAPEEGKALTNAEATKLGCVYDSNGYSGTKYYLSGVITGFYGSSAQTYGNVYIKDANGDTILVYGLYSADGKTRYDSMATKPQIGDEITVYGEIGNYKGTAQMRNGWLQSHTIAVAKVGDEYFTDVQEAIKAAAPDGTVEILNDVVVDEWIMFAEKLNISNGNIITLNINGLTINGNGKTLTINSIESAGNGNRLFFDAENLNINNLTIKYADGLAGGIGLKSGVLNNVTFDGGVYGVLPGNGDVTIEGCTFQTNGTSIYFEEERDNLVVTGNTFKNPDNVNVILLRGDVQFTDNTVESGRTVNVVSGSPVVSGNNFNDVRFKVYNVATATISDNTINNLEFSDESSATMATFEGNTLSESAAAALEVVLPVATVVSGDTTTYYKSLADAFAAVTNGSTLTIYEGTYDYKLVLGASTSNITVIGKGEVTLNGTPSIKGTNYRVENLNFVYADSYNNLSGSGYIKDCTFTNTTNNTFRYCYGVTNGEITFEGCTLTAAQWAIHFDSTAGTKLTFIDCDITGHVALAADLGSLTATDTTFANGYVNVWGTAEETTFTGCEFNNLRYIFTGYDKGNTFKFNDCTVVDDENAEAGVTDIIWGGSDSANADIYVDDVLKTGDAKIGETYYKTLQDALDAAKGEENIVIDLVKDATLDITAWETLAIGGDTTKTITINGNGKTLTFNKKNSDWNHITTNNDAKLILNNMTITDSGYNNGPWNRYDLNFACDVELNNVTATKALAFKGDAVLNTVTINEAGDNYAIWIQPNGQTIAIDDLTVNSAGRGIKIDQQYVGSPAKVALSVENATFATAKKAAILVKSTAGAEITLNNVDISGVQADSTNAVWNDSDAGETFGGIVVNGGSIAQEDATDFGAMIVSDGTVVGYYKDLQAALAVVGEGQVITLNGNVTLDSKITVADGVVIDLNGNTLNVNVENSYFGNVTIKNGNIVLGKDDVHVCDGYFLVNENKTLVIDDVNITSAEGGIKTYAVFHLKTGAGLDIIDSKINLGENEYAAGYFAYAGEKTATVDITGTELTVNGNGIVHATTAIDNSTIVIDAAEHGINRSGVAINDSNVTIFGGWGRGITAQHGALEITGNSTVTVYNMDEASIELRGDQNLVIAETATVKLSAAVNNTTAGTVSGEIIKVAPVANADGGYDLVDAAVELGGTYYASLADAVAVGGEIKLLADIALAETLVVSNDVVLDLAGHALTYTSDVQGESMITVKGSLTINDSAALRRSGSSTGSISYVYTGAADPNYGKGNYTISNSGSLTINGGTIEISAAGVEGKFSHALYAIHNAGDLTINGGKIISWNNVAIRNWNAADITVNGGEIEGTRAIWLQLPSNKPTDAPEVNIIITGGTLTATGESGDNKLAIYSYSYGQDMKNVALNISGGTFNGDIALTGGANKTNIEKVNITGGTFNGKWGEVYSYGDEALAAAAISITGGTFATDAASVYAADDGFVFVQNAEGTYSLVEASAATPSIGDNGNWFIGDVDTGIKAEGITPLLKVENGYIWVSYDNGATWEEFLNLDDITGEDGKDGVDGAPGKDGVDGEDGKDGVDGAPGKDGVDGEDGKDGVDGAPGKDGVDGEDGKDGVDGAPGKDGVDGEQGPAGPAGPAGADGKDGADGEDGKDGADGKDGNDNNKVVIYSIAIATVCIILSLAVILYRGVKRRSWWCFH